MGQAGERGTGFSGHGPKIFRVEFDFQLDQEVRTPFGNKGIVRMLAYDESGVLYNVQTREALAWIKESQLKLWEEDDKAD